MSGGGGGRFGAIKFGEHEASRPARWRKCGCPQRRAPATGSAREGTRPEKTNTRPKKQATRPKKRTRAPEQTTKCASEKTFSRPKLLPRKLPEKTNMYPPKKLRKNTACSEKTFRGGPGHRPKKQLGSRKNMLCFFGEAPGTSRKTHFLLEI